MLRQILHNNNISICKYGLGDQDLTFIEEMIEGTKEADRRGREKKKHFLYGKSTSDKIQKIDIRTLVDCYFFYLFRTFLQILLIIVDRVSTLTSSITLR